MITTMIGETYFEILDNIGAYFYFPLAIAKESYVKEGIISVRVKPVAGSIDQAGGLAFGIRNVGNYFVFRINTLEDNVILFEFVNNKRLKRATTPVKAAADRWYQLRVEFADYHCRGFLDQEPVIDFHADRPLDGYVGLWTKADSVTQFADLSIESQGQRRVVGILGRDSAAPAALLPAMDYFNYGQSNRRSITGPWPVYFHIVAS